MIDGDVHDALDCAVDGDCLDDCPWVWLFAHCCTLQCDSFSDAVKEDASWRVAFELVAVDAVAKASCACWFAGDDKWFAIKASAAAARRADFEVAAVDAAEDSDIKVRRKVSGGAEAYGLWFAPLRRDAAPLYYGGGESCE